MNVSHALLGSLLQLLVSVLLFYVGRCAVYTPRQVVAFYLRKESGRAKRRLLEATKREGYFLSLKIAGLAFLGASAGMFILAVFTLTRAESS